MTTTIDQTDGEFALPAILDSRTAAALRDDLVARRGAPLALNGAQVGLLGAQCAQVLLAAVRTWREDGYVLRTDDISVQMNEDLELLGLSGQDLAAGDTLQ